MKTKILAILILLVGLALPLLSQPSVEHLEKYWYYRERLKNDFIYYTGNPSIKGSHQPIECRADYYTDHRESFIRMGDATANLGYYIALLALEWKLLNDNGQFDDCLQTKDELEKALEAFERLDINAENCFREQIEDPPPSSDINGFFLRDDMGGDDQEDLMEIYFDVKRIISGYLEHCGPNIGEDENVISQDQAIGLFLGFKMVKNYVQVQELQTKSEQSTNDIIEAMKATNWIPIALIFNDLWRIENPITEDVVPIGGDFFSLYSFCWALATSAGYITGEDEHYAYSSSPWNKEAWDLAQNSILEFANGTIIQIPIWINPLGVPIFLGFFELEFQPFNSSMIGKLSALTNEWGNGPDNLYDWLVDFCNDTQGMYGMPANIGVLPYLPLIGRLLNGYTGNNLIPASYYENEFWDKAPPCGAFHYVDAVGTTLDISVPPWHTLSLFSPWHYEPDGGNLIDGDYTMMDYMLMYNAYFCNYYDDPVPYLLIEEDYYPTGSRAYQGGVKNVSPSNTRVAYNNMGPVLVSVPRRIDANNSIYSGAEVTYKAGSEIHLLEGFHARQGSTFNALIDPSLNNDIYYEKTTTDPCGRKSYNSMTKYSEMVANDIRNNISEQWITEEGLSKNFDEESQDFSIFPNPSSGIFFVYYPQELVITNH